MTNRMLDDVLREVKDDLLCYCVVCEYGSMDMGLDDTGIPDDERECRIIAAPVGFLGQLRVIWQGSVSSLREVDLYVRPKPVSNPPSHDELIRKNGHWRRGAFMYGSTDAIQDWPDQLKKRKAANSKGKGDA